MASSRIRRAGRRNAALFQHYAPQWLALLPLLREIVPKATSQKLPSTTREGLHQSVVVALEALSQQRPVILWVDDLHWADLSTITFAWALNSGVWFGILSRNVAVVREYVGAQLPVCTEYTFAYLLATTRIVQGWVQAIAKHDANGLTQIAQGCATLDNIGAQISQLRYRTVLVEAAILLQQWAAAQEALVAACQVQSHSESHWYTAELARWQAELFLQKRGRRASHIWFTEGFESKDLQEAKTLFDELSKRSR